MTRQDEPTFEELMSEEEDIIDLDDRRRQQEAPPPGDSDAPADAGVIESELEWARRFIADHGDVLLHVWEWSRWFVWDGRRWDDGRQDEVRRLAKKTARKRTRAALSEGAESIRLARAAESARGIEATLKLAASEIEVAVKHEGFDAQPMALNVNNGTVCLVTGVLRPHQREDMITKLAPVDYDPEATCPTWDRFVTEILPEPGVRHFVQRYLGYCLTAEIGEQVLAFFHGEGANGKSTMLGAVQHIMGDYATLAPSGLLIARRHEAHPTELTVLHGRRLGVCSEIESGNRLAEVQVKQLTGGDLITARRMREDFWTFAPTHKLIISANHKPRVRGTDEAIWRRMKLIPFEVIVPEGERDPKLPEKLIKEAPGILAWMVAGCLEWQQIGLAPPPEVDFATAKYRTEQDRVGSFIEECCHLGDTTVSKGALYKAFAEWAKESGEQSMSKKAFGTEMLKRGIDEERTRSGRIWIGIGLRGGE